MESRLWSTLTFDSLYPGQYMRNLRFWIPPIIGVVLTPLCFFAALVSTGAGHGSYGAMFLLYPVPSAILLLFAGLARDDSPVQKLSMVLVFGIAILQFPFYGFVLSYARLKDYWWLTITAGIIWLHILGIVVWLVLATIMWVIVK